MIVEVPTRALASVVVCAFPATTLVAQTDTVVSGVYFDLHLDAGHKRYRESLVR